jgi:hypothetical protein
MSNPHPYYEVARSKHPEAKPEWIERVLITPYHKELAVDGDLVVMEQRSVYYGYIPEEEKWLIVIVDEDMLFNAYFDRKLLKRWGRPE